jgi:SSS family solute:Na+ symporter
VINLTIELIIGISVLAFYLVLGTILAVLYRKRISELTEKEYYIAGGRLGGFLSSMTYAATTYSAFMIVGLVGFAYSTGVGSLGFELAYFISTLAILTVFAPRVWMLSRRRGWVTPGDMLADLLGSRSIAVTASALYLIALIPYASAQLKGIGEAIAGLAHSTSWYAYGVIIGLAVMLVWSLVAGIWSVAVTDALQGLWMIAAATLFLAWVAWRVHQAVSLPRATELLESNGLLGLSKFWRPEVMLAFTLPWIFFAVTNPQVVQRLYMPKDEKSLKNMIRWFGIFGFYYTLVVVLIGLLARSGSLTGIFPIVKNKDEVTPTLLYLANPALSAIVFTSIVAAAVSTADSILLTLAGSASKDLDPKGRSSLKRGYVAAVIVAILMSLVALERVSYIVMLSVLSSLLLLPLAPITLIAWSGYRPKWYLSLLSILLGEAIIAYETISTGSPLKAFLSAPLKVPLAGWVLLVGTAVALIKLEKISFTEEV